MVVFPDLAVTGCPPRDLLEYPAFVEKNRQAVYDLARQVTRIAVVLGFVDVNPEKAGKPWLNAVALLHGGRVAAVRHKMLLPTYDVFDEGRHFAPGRDNAPVAFSGRKLGLTICEDMWTDVQFMGKRLYPDDPVLSLTSSGAEILINVSGSPFHHKKSRQRLDLVRSHVQRAHVPFFFVNQVGGNDELVFDGSSFALDAEGRVLAQARSFAEDLVVAGTDPAQAPTWEGQAPIEGVP